MAFKPAAGYGDMFSASASEMRAAGFEIQHFSKPILRNAIDQLVFSRFMTPSTDAFGKGKGGTFTIRFAKDFGAISSVSALTSGTAIGIGSQAWDKVEMNMYEYGTGVGVEDFANMLTDIDLQMEVQQTLGRHVGRMINWLDFDIFNKTNKAIEVGSMGSYGYIGTNRAGLASATAFGELGPGGVALAYDTLRGALVEPLTDGGLYGMLGNADTFRHLKSGSIFANQTLWGNMSGMTYQVLGQFNGFLFVETSENLNKGTTFAFGKNVGGYGFGMNPRTFLYPDFGSDAGRLGVFKTLFYRGQGAIRRSVGTACIIIRSKTTGFDYGALG